jgi:exosortase K
MMRQFTSRRGAQLVVVALCAVAVKLYYSTAGVNQLRWILAPTTLLVELVSGSRFEFEPHAGYINGDRTFIIAASCAGVNFLVTSFLMLSLIRLWRGRPGVAAWRLIPWAALCAYLSTLVANAARISTALLLRATPREPGWLTPNQLHRFEGVFVYFGFLLLLFALSEKVGSEKASSSEKSPALFGRLYCPLLFYYATTLGVPLANGAYRRGADFREHALFVLLTPLLLILPLAAISLYGNRRAQRSAGQRPVTHTLIPGG